MGLAVNDERLARKVGAGLLALVGIAAVATVMFDGVHLSPGAHIHVYFEHTGSLKEGDDFQIAGRVIGEVKAMRLVPPHKAADPEHPLYPNGGIIVDVRIEREYLDMTMDNGEVFVSAKGLIGRGYLEMGAPADGAAPGPPLANGAEIRGVDPPRLDRVMMRSYQNLLTSKIFLAEVTPAGKRLVAEASELIDNLAAVEPQPGAFRELASAAGELAGDIDRVRTKWETSGVELADLQDLMNKARATGARAQQAVRQVQERLTALESDLARLRKLSPADMQRKLELALAKTRTSLAKLDRIQAAVDDMMAMIDRGEGNIGGLMNDPEFSDYAKKIGKALKRTPWKTFSTQRE